MRNVKQCIVSYMLYMCFMGRYAKNAQTFDTPARYLQMETEISFNYPRSHSVNRFPGETCL